MIDGNANVTFLAFTGIFRAHKFRSFVKRNAFIALIARPWRLAVSQHALKFLSLTNTSGRDSDLAPALTEMLRGLLHAARSGHKLKQPALFGGRSLETDTRNTWRVHA